MPDFQALKEQEKAKLQAFYANDDAEGLYLYIFNSICEADRGYRAGKGVQFSDTPLGAAWDAMMYSLCNDQGDPDIIAFRERLLKITAKKEVEAILNTGRKHEEVVKQIENGEGEGFELIASDPKNVEVAASALTGYKSEIGRYLQDIVNTTVVFTLFVKKDSNASFDKIDELHKHFAELKERALAEDKRFSADEKKRYFSRYSHNYDNNFMIGTTTEDHDECQISYVADGSKDNGLVFDKVPTIDSNIRKMSSAELEAYRKQLESEKRCIEKYEETVKPWKDTASKLLQELEANSTEKEKKTAAYRNLSEALGWNAKFGDGVTLHPPGKENETKTFLGCFPTTFRELTNVLKNAAEQYPDNDQKNKILSAVNAYTEKFSKALAAGADKVFKKNGREFKPDPKQYQRDINRIDAEQKRRSLPLGRKLAIKENIQKIQKLAQQQDSLVFFKQDFQDSQMENKVIGAWFKKDLEGREIPETKKNKHKEYFNLIDKITKLDKANVTALSPKQLGDLMKEAKKAADTYVSTHAGMSNITKGWYDDGRDRIKYAKQLSDNLGKKLKKMEPVLNTFDAEKEPLSYIYQNLENKKERIRNDNALLKDTSLPFRVLTDEVLEERDPGSAILDSNIPDDPYSIEFSQKSIAALLTSSEEHQNKPEDSKQIQNAVFSHIADMIATMITAKQFGSVESKKAQENRDSVSRVIQNGVAFKNMKRSSQTPEAFEKLVTKALKKNPGELVFDYIDCVNKQKQIEKTSKKPTLQSPDLDGLKLFQPK